MTQALALLTAEDFVKLQDGQLSELVRGRVIPMNMPVPRHGVVCSNIGFLLAKYLDEHDIGRVMTNDTGVITERGPDTVRGVDVAFFSYDRLPRNARPDRYPESAPDIAFEVLSPSDRPGEVQTKVGEYLRAGARRVCVVHWRRNAITVYWPDDAIRTYEESDVIDLSDILPGFRLSVRDAYKW